MKKVERDELLGLAEYEKLRDPFRSRVIEEKKRRRVSVGPHMTFVFENHDTVLLQIQEMLRTERISAEKAVLHELETYNELVPGEGELSATLLIEYEEQDERRAALDAFADLEGHVFLDVNGESYPARFRPLPGEEPGRLPAVNYVSFSVGRSVAAALRKGGTLAVRHPHYDHSVTLAAGAAAELADDLEAP